MASRWNGMCSACVFLSSIELHIQRSADAASACAAAALLRQCGGGCAAKTAALVRRPHGVACCLRQLRESRLTEFEQPLHQWVPQHGRLVVHGCLAAQHAQRAMPLPCQCTPALRENTQRHTLLPS